MPISFSEAGIRVTARYGTLASLGRDFGRTLFLTNSAGLGVDERTLAFANNDAVRTATNAAGNTRFTTGDEVLTAAARYFAQQPRGQFVVGRWQKASVDAVLTGSTPGVIADFNALGSTGTLTINGTTITSPDLSSTADLPAVAAALQTAIQAVTGFAGVTLAFSGGVFTLTLPALRADPLPTGTLADELGLSMPATVVQGAPTETNVQALDAIEGEDAGWFYGIHGGSPTDDEIIAAQTWAGTHEHAILFNLIAVNDSALSATSTTDIAARLATGGIVQTAGFYTRDDDDNKAASFAGEWAAVDWQQARGFRAARGKWARLTGCTPDTFNATQLGVLETKRTNAYIRVGYAGANENEATPVVVEGLTYNEEVYWDTFVWISELRARIERAMFNLLAATGQESVGFDMVGFARTRARLIDEMNVGVLNGSIAPNSAVSADARAEIIATTGDSAFTGLLPLGYRVWLQPAGQITPTNRAARIWPYRIWAVGSDAVHGYTGIIDAVPSGAAVAAAA